MKSLFAKDINQAAFIAYEKFEMLKRPANMNIVDVRNEFERLYNNVEKIWHGVVYNSANIYIAKECRYI